MILNPAIKKEYVMKNGTVAGVYGLFIYKGFRAGEESIKSFCADYGKGKHDFNKCLGSYRVSFSIPDGRKVCFIDNAGMMQAYLDIGRGEIFTTLEEACGLKVGG